MLLHGPGRTLADWSVIGPLLTEQFRVIAVDIRGHGESENGLWSWELSGPPTADNGRWTVIAATSV